MIIQFIAILNDASKSSCFQEISCSKSGPSGPVPFNCQVRAQAGVGAPGAPGRARLPLNVGQPQPRAGRDAQAPPARAVQILS